MKGFKHLTYVDRLKLETLYKEGFTPPALADRLSCSISTIYRELKKGMCEQIDSEYRIYTTYSATIAQQIHDYNATNKGTDLKIGNDYILVEYIESKIINEQYSPDAIIGEIKQKQLQFTTSICTKTLYNYIDMGIFPNVTNDSLLLKTKRTKPYRKVGKTPITNTKGTSIEKRPKHVDDRLEFGHWEMDTVVGKLKGKSTSLLVLSERMTRQELIIKINQKTASNVVKAMNRLERKYKQSFSKIFKTITVDNGSEFLAFEELQKSCIYKNKDRTQIFYCHPYSSWERGTNENINKMIRRFIPKGTPIDRIPPSQIKLIEHWINNYPRKIHNYQSANALFMQNIELLLNT